MSELRTMDLGQGDVHIDGAPLPKKAKTMSDLTSTARKALPTGEFADPAERKYPIHDKAHADVAASYLEKERATMSPAKYRQIKSNIISAQKRFGEQAKKPARRQMRKMALMIDHPQHGRIEVYRMSDKQLDDTLFLLGGIELGKHDLLAKGVWNQVAKQGRFYKDGQFFEMTETTFKEIIANFKATQNHEIPVDFEHASEASGSAGQIPVMGAPAQGWIKDLQLRNGELWGNIEFGTLAKEYIRDGSYKYFSPAVRFGRKATQGPNVGKPIGALLSSGALVNIPFLDGLKPLQCKDEPKVAESISKFNASHYAVEESKANHLFTAKVMMGNRAYSTAEYMPKLKACLKLSDLHTPEECKDAFNRLRTHYVAAGGNINAQPQGVDLCSHMMALRDFTQARPTDSWDDVLDTVQDMIDEAMQEHVAQYHEGGASMDDDAGGGEMKDAVEAVASEENTNHEATASNNGEMQMADKVEELTVQLKNTETKVTTLTEKTAELTVRLKDAESAKDKLELEKTEALAKVTAAEDKLALAQTELKTLKDEAEKTAEASRTSIVDTTIACYGKTKGLTEKNKPALLRMLKNDGEGFFEMYPKVSADKVHLMKDAVSEKGNHREMKDGEVNGGGASATSTETSLPNVKDGELFVRDQSDIVKQLMKDNPNMTLEDSIEQAFIEQQKDITLVAGRRVASRQ